MRIGDELVEHLRDQVRRAVDAQRFAGNLACEGTARKREPVTFDASGDERAEIEPFALDVAQALLETCRFRHPRQDLGQAPQSALRALDVHAGLVRQGLLAQVVERGAHDGEWRAKLVRQAARHILPVARVLRQAIEHRLEAARKIADLVAGP